MLPTSLRPTPTFGPLSPAISPGRAVRVPPALLIAGAALIALLLLPAGVSAQTYREVEQGKLESLPHALTPDEELIRDQIGITHRSGPPPAAQPVRALAEFEHMQGVLIRYPLGISTAIVAEMSEDVIIYCIVTAAQQQNAYNAFVAGGVNMSNVIFFNASSDSYWTRDYGPWFVYDADGELSIIDTIYNRPRPNDDEIPAEFGAFLSLPVYSPDLIHTGGNWMNDGHDVAISTTLVYEENPTKTVAQIEDIVGDYCGIGTYHCYPDVNNEYIEHIDCWAKFLALDKILIREVPISHSQYDEIEAAVDYFAAQVSSYGTPYQIFRVGTPGNEPYTNSLILNDKVLVPVMGGSHPDAAAIAAYQAAMPGYEVLGFTGSWASTDALHCRAKGVGDPGYLYVYTIPLRDTADDDEPYRVSAEIVAHSGAGLTGDEPRLYWRSHPVDPYSFTEMAMIAGTDSFYADIPAQPIGTTIQYYIHAADESGRQETCPLVGPAGPFEFTVDLDTEAPVIAETTELPWTADTTGPYTVACTVTDDMHLDAVTLFYRVGGGAFQAVSMTLVQAADYAADIPGQDYPAHIEYYVHAEDEGDNVAVDPAGAPAWPYEFYVLPSQEALAADFEGASSWSHQAVTGGFTDQWHLSAQRNHTPGGSTSWKCGAQDSGSYASLLDAGLLSEPFDLPPMEGELSFWHYVQAETSSTYAGYAYDGGRVEIDTGSGWQILTPAGGYPFLVRGTSGPFPAESGIFSGHHGWHEVRVDLTGLSGTARIRFRFGSDSAVGDEGWYIDDVRVAGFALDPAVLDDWGIADLSADPAHELRLVCGPNPVTAATRLGFRLARPGAVRLAIFDSTGRLVRTLFRGSLPAGIHALAWDGRDDRAQAVGSGVYFSKLVAPRGHSEVRLVVIE
ncbi:MAG: agmatine deiminase family protein [Candidatus Eisenbacteria bacterium]